MKRWSIVATLIMAIAVFVSAQNKTVKPTASRNTDDEAAIRSVLSASGKGWSAGDAKLASSVYTEDAQWMNAFGRRKNGRAEIEAFLTWLFAHPGEQNTKSTARRDFSIKFLRPDVAVVHFYQEVTGQLTDDGKETPKRRIHVTKIVTKENGKWLIANEVIMDERDSL